jgi:hypothetical protein
MSPFLLPFAFQSFSPRDMDEYEDSQSPAPSYQYPKETLRKRQNSVQNSGGSVSSRFSRKSFKLDYRLEEDVTKSKKGKDGRFVNPWPTWKNISIPNVLRWLIMEKNHSGVPGSKEVGSTWLVWNGCVLCVHIHDLVCLGGMGLYLVICGVSV